MTPAPSGAAEARPVEGKPAVRRWAVLAAVLVGESLDLLNAAVTAIAAPGIARDLGGGAALVQWLGASYPLALGALLVVGGRLGDRYGRRRLFLVGAGGFTVASLVCAASLGPVMIVVARMVQGVFGALLLPQGFGLLGAVFPREQLSKAFSAFGPALGFATVAGPILGGLLVEANLFGLGWRPIFLTDLVLGGATFLLAARVLPRDVGDRRVRVDPVGAVVLGTAMVGMLYGLVNGSEHGWSGASLVPLAAGLGAFGGFCWRQRHAEHPLIEPSLLRNRGFAAGLTLGVVFFAAAAGLLYVLPLYLQSALGRSPLRAAIELTPCAVGILLAATVSYRLIGALGRHLVLIGLLVALAGTGWLALVIDAGHAAAGRWELVAPVLVIGLALGTCFGTVYDITIGDVAPHEAGSGSGSLAAVEQLANGAGTAAVSTVYFGTLAGNGHTHAMSHSLLAVAGAVLACCGLVWLLPRQPPARFRTPPA